MAMVALELQGPKFMEALVNHVTAYVGETAPAQPFVLRQPRRRLASSRRSAATRPTASRRAATRSRSSSPSCCGRSCSRAVLVLQRFTILVMTGAGERVQFGIRKRLFAHLQRLSMSYYDKTKLGRIISRCTSDVSSMREINVWGLYTIFANLLMMLFAAVMLATTDRRLFLAVAPLGRGAVRASTACT